MKKMKIFMVVTLFTTILFSSCVRADINGHSSSKSTEKKERITVTDYVVIDGIGYSIVHVDGHSYLSSGSHGAIIHLESCSCKQ
jgi:hypothetical protein